MTVAPDTLLKGASILFYISSFRWDFSRKGVTCMGLDTILVVFTILSGIVAIIDLVKYAIALVRWIVKMICNEKK